MYTLSLLDSSLVRRASSNSKDHPPVFFDVYVFNITNPYEMLNGSAPHVEEIGPIRYKMNDIKVNISFNEDKTNVSYVLYRHYTPLNPEAEKMNITTINLVFQAMYAQAGAFAVDVLYSKATEFEALFMQRPVHEVLWGYHSPVLQEAKDAGLTDSGACNSVALQCDKLVVIGIRLISFLCSVLLFDLAAWFPGLQQNLTSPMDAYNQTGIFMEETGRCACNRSCIIPVFWSTVTC